MSRKSPLAPAITLLDAESRRLLAGTYEERTRGEAFLRALQFLRETHRKQMPLEATEAE